MLISDIARLIAESIHTYWEPVDEKLSFEVLSINADGYPAIVVLDGGGYRQGAKQWLRGQAGKNRLLYVFNLGDFQRYASRGEL